MENIESIYVSPSFQNKTFIQPASKSKTTFCLGNENASFRLAGLRINIQWLKRLKNGQNLNMD